MADNGRHHDRRWADISSDEEAEIDMYDRQEMMTRLAVAENGNFTHDHYDLSTLRRAVSGSGSSGSGVDEAGSGSRQDSARWSDQVSEAEEEAAAIEQEEARRLEEESRAQQQAAAQNEQQQEEAEATPEAEASPSNSQPIPEEAAERPPEDEEDDEAEGMREEPAQQVEEEQEDPEQVDRQQEEAEDAPEEMEDDEYPPQEDEEEAYQEVEPVAEERDEEAVPSPKAVLQSHRDAVLKDALELARKLRELAVVEEAANPPVRTCEQACQTDLHAEDVLRMEAVRERLLKRRRVQEEQEQGGLAAREAQLEVKRKKVEKARGELAEAQKAQQARQKQQAQEIANLDREIKAAEAKLAEPLEQVDKSANQVLQNELQSLQAENNAALQAVQRVREDEKVAKKEIEDLEQQVAEFQAKLERHRNENHALERELAASKATVIKSQKRLAEVEAKKRVAEQDLEEENRLAKEDWDKTQDLEDEMRSLSGALRQTEEAKTVWNWRLNKVIKQIEKLDRDSIFVRRLLEAGQT